MEIKHSHDDKKGRFYIELEGKEVATMTYVYAGPALIIIDHTEVHEVLRGKNAGKSMVEQAVTFARDHHLKILPLCPFAKKVFEKTPEFHDVWSA